MCQSPFRPSLPCSVDDSCSWTRAPPPSRTKNLNQKDEVLQTYLHMQYPGVLVHAVSFVYCTCRLCIQLYVDHRLAFNRPGAHGGMDLVQLLHVLSNCKCGPCASRLLTQNRSVGPPTNHAGTHVLCADCTQRHLFVRWRVNDRLVVQSALDAHSSLTMRSISRCRMSSSPS